MASDGLTADQRIALQCLVSSAGEPSSFATCTLGRLAFKELMNCIDSRIGEGACMGENNDLRKLLAAFGIDISSQTVIGQLLNVPLDLAKHSVALAQAALSGLDDLGKNLGRELARVDEFVANVAAAVAAA